ncbi:uncharacterized protein LOC122713164 [Apis laboriosa]|uniref:uncharacterized protein LOC122713164 n=1 Tax=Apis laboriosa TaxID=183418 RepID=UPI001CC724E0|nr:uncharacterized protein LOC122713164 [Apis laboriosa]
MKYEKKKKRRCYKKKMNKNLVNPLKIINSIRRQPFLKQYIFYAILNTDLHMNRGVAAANIAKCLMFLHNILDSDQVKSQYIDTWMKTGQRIIVLKGYDHKHLKYLEDELKFIAIQTYAVRHFWNRNQAIIALAVFGLKEDIEEIFEGMSYLR